MSDTDQIFEELRKLEFFQGMPDEHLQQVASISRHAEFPAHHDVFREYEPAKEVFMITQGKVSLVICAPTVGCRQLMEVGPGELMGWSPLVGQSRLSDTARTLAATKAIAIDGERLLAFCTQEPRFGFELMHRVAKTLTKRLNATRLQLLKMSGLQLPEVQIESD